MFRHLRAAVVAAAMVGASAASATTVNVDFNVSTPSSLTKTYDIDPLGTLEVSAQGPVTNGSLADAWVLTRVWVITNGQGTSTPDGVARGLGVVNDPTNAAAVDVERGRIAAPETVSFTTSRKTKLTSIGIAQSPFATEPQMFDILVDGNFFGAYTVTLANTTATSVQDFLVGAVGSVFTVRPTNTGQGSGIFVNTISIASVPGPATAPLLGGALVLGAVAVRRRRKAVAA